MTQHELAHQRRDAGRAQGSRGYYYFSVFTCCDLHGFGALAPWTSTCSATRDSRIVRHPTRRNCPPPPAARQGQRLTQGAQEVRNQVSQRPQEQQRRDLESVPASGSGPASCSYHRQERERFATEGDRRVSSEQREAQRRQIKTAPATVGGGEQGNDGGVPRTTLLLSWPGPSLVRRPRQVTAAPCDPLRDRTGYPTQSLCTPARGSNKHPGLRPHSNSQRDRAAHSADSASCRPPVRRCWRAAVTRITGPCTPTYCGVDAGVPERDAACQLKVRK